MQEGVIGKFKTKNKYLSFISGSKFSGQNIRFNRDSAYINGSKLSGMLEGIKFKITLCDDNSIEFEEVETSKVDEATIKRLIDDIECNTIIGYAEKFILEGLEFRDEDNSLCYLEVENSKPINKLKKLLEDSKSSKSLSTKGLSALDKFLSLNNVADTKVDEPVLVTKVQVVEKQTVSDLEASFKKMNEEKLLELKDRIEKLQNEKLKYKQEIKVNENRVDKIEKDIEILNVRLDDFGFKEELNGYVFFVSEEKEKMELDDRTIEIIDKIAEIAKMNSKAIKSIVSESRFEIKIAKKDNINELVNDDEVIQLLKFGKFMKEEDYFIHIGNIKWGELVSKLEKLGFEQDPEFNKLCGSNSYNSKVDLDDKN